MLQLIGIMGETWVVCGWCGSRVTGGVGTEWLCGVGSVGTERLCGVGTEWLCGVGTEWLCGVGSVSSVGSV